LWSSTESVHHVAEERSVVLVHLSLKILHHSIQLLEEVWLISWEFWITAEVWFWEVFGVLDVMAG
jgi:hypothetical protein